MRPPQLSDILDVVTLATGITVARMRSPSMLRSIYHARALFVHLALRWTDRTFEAIGVEIARTSSATIRCSASWLREVERFPALAALRDACDAQLAGGFMLPKLNLTDPAQTESPPGDRRSRGRHRRPHQFWADAERRELAA